MKKKATILIFAVLLIVAAFSLTACDLEEITGVDTQGLINLAKSAVGVLSEVAEYSTIVSDENGNSVVELQINGVNYVVTLAKESNEVQKVKINDREVKKNEIPTTPFAQNNQYVGIVAAKATVFADAGVPEGVTVNAHTGYDFDDGEYLYEISFMHNRIEYEYDVKASDGTIHKKEVDHITTIEPTPSTGEEFIGVEAAKTAALNAANVLPADALFDQVELDFDKGTYVYEIEFVTADNEYEYEINATTGAVIKNERKHNGAQPNQGGNLIGVDAAKAAALAHAGLNEANFTEAKTETDRGTTVYEIEFIANGYEYEYEINAHNGNIIKAEKELDD